MPQPSASSTQRSFLNDQAFSLGIEGERWSPEIMLLSIPRKNGKNIGVVPGPTAHMLIWDDCHKMYMVDDILSLIARIYELIETP